MGPHVYMRTVLSCAGENSSICWERLLYRRTGIWGEKFNRTKRDLPSRDSHGAVWAGHTRPPEFSDMLPRWEEDSDYKSDTMHLCVLVIAAALCSCFYNVSISSHPTASSAFLPHFEPEFASL